MVQKLVGVKFLIRSQMAPGTLCMNHQLLEFQPESSVLASVTLRYMC